MGDRLERWERDVLGIGGRIARLVLRAVLVFVVAAGVGLGAMWAAHRMGWEVPAPLNTILAEAVQVAEPLLYVYDNDTGWRPRPYTQLHHVSRGPFQRGEAQDARVRTNGDGFFDREHYAATSYYRIAFMGDSWVEAQQLDASLRFTNLVEGYVYARSNGARAVETMNFGVANLGLAQEFGLARKAVLKYKPDEIWVMFYAGDDLSDSTPMLTVPPLGPTFRYAADGETIEDVTFGFVQPPPITEALRRKRYGAWADFTPAGLLPYLYASEEHPAFATVMRETRSSLRLLKKLADSIGAKLVIMYMPPRYEYDTARWREYVGSARHATGAELHLDAARGESRIGAMVREEGATFFSLRPLMIEKGPDEMLQGHLSRMGHHWVAEAITRRLLEGTCCAVPDAGRSR